MIAEANAVTNAQSTEQNKGQPPKGRERLAFSMALDLLFNGQHMDYVERPISLSVFDQVAFFDELQEGDKVCVVGPGGGRLVKTLAERGLQVDAFEGRVECVDHLHGVFDGWDNVNIRPYEELLDEETRRDMRYMALFNMDDLRAFRDDEEWTSEIEKVIEPHGYFVYSQISNQLPKKRNTLRDYFKLVGNYNVSDETADQIRASYFGINEWDPDTNQYNTAKEALRLLESAKTLRRNILSGVEIRYFVWQKFSTKKTSRPNW